MAANIFELIIGSDGGGVLSNRHEIILSNLNFWDWSYDNYLGYNAPDEWSLVSGFTPAFSGVLATNYLGLNNDDFSGSWMNTFEPIDYDGAHNSFYKPAQWIVNMFTIANGGLNHAGTGLIESATNAGYPYYKPASAAEAVPDLTIYGRNSAGTIPERVGLTWSASNIPPITSTLPSSITHENNEPYLTDVFFSGDYGLHNSYVLKFGSASTLNALYGSNIHNYYLGGALGMSDRQLVLKSELLAYHNYIGDFAFDVSDMLHYSNVNYYYNNEGISVKGKPKYTSPKYSSLSESSFAPSLKYDEAASFRDTSAPLIFKLENIFPAHVIGTWVSFDVTLGVGSLAPSITQSLPHSYSNNGTNLGSNTYSDMSASAAQFDVTQGVVSATSIGQFYPLTTLPTEEYRDSDTFGRLHVVPDSHLVLQNIDFDASSLFIARAEMVLEESNTYHVSLNLKERKGDLKVIIRALNSNGSDQSILHTELIGDGNETTPEIMQGEEEITHFTFNTETHTTKYAIDLQLENYNDFEVYSKINYIRFESSRYGIQEYVLREDYDEDSNSYSPRINSSGKVIHGSSSIGVNSLASLIITSSPVVSYPLAYSQFDSASSSSSRVTRSETPDSDYAPYGNDVTEVISLELPFNNPEGVYVSGEEQVGNEVSTFKIIPSDFSELLDSDGCFNQALTVTARIEMLVGSSDLRIFVDNSFSDNVILSKVNIYSVSFLDSTDSFITRETTGLNQIRLKYDPANGVRAPFLAQTDSIEAGVIGEDIQIDYNVTSLSGSDSLVIDTGEGTEAVFVTSSGVGSQVVSSSGGSFLRVRTETLAEKGSPLGGLDATIDYVKVSEFASTEPPSYVKAMKLGNEFTADNQGGLYLPYDSALVVINQDSAGQMASGAVSGVSMNRVIPLNLIQEASSITISVSVTLLSSSSYVTVRHNLEGIWSDTVINTASATPVDILINDTSSLPSTPWLELHFANAGGSSDLFQVVIANVVITTDTAEEVASSISLDLLEDFEVPITSSIKDFRDLGSSSSSFSKTINLPATAKNKLAFKFENELNSMSNKYSWSGDFQHIKPIRFDLKAEGVSVFKGYANLLGATLNEDGFSELEVNLVSGNADWVEVLGEVELKSIPSNQYIITSSNIIDSFSNASIDDEIYFPLVDNGEWKVRNSLNPEAANVGWDNLKAAFGIRVLVDKIFKLTGYTLVSDFFNGGAELSTESSIDLASFSQRLIGIAPSMSKPKFAINNSELEVSFDPSLMTGGGYHKQNSASYDNPQAHRPFVDSAYHGALLASAYDLSEMYSRGYYVDFAYIHCNSVRTDNSNAHSLEDIGSSDKLLGFEAEEDVALLKLNSNSISTGNSKSVIQVAESGYYDLDIGVGFDLLSAGEEFVESAGFALGGGDEAKITVMLLSEDDAINDIYITDIPNIYPDPSASFGFEAFDFYDENSVVMSGTTYSETRVALSRVQFLEVGKKYNIVVMVGIQYAFHSSVSLNSSFVVNELDLSLKLSESPAPMKGRWNMIYKEAAAPRVSYLEVLPDVKAIEFISELTKMFNLMWTTNQITKEITVEPFDDFYDFSGVEFGFRDLTDKALITKVSNNEITGSEITYSMAEDSSDFALNGNPSGDSSLNFGDKKISLSLNGLSNSANPHSSKSNDISLGIFAALNMGYDKFISRTTAGSLYQTNISAETGSISRTTLRLPQIWSTPKSSLEPTLSEHKPTPNNSHKYKLAYIKGVAYTDPWWQNLADLGIDVSITLGGANPAKPAIYYSLEDLAVQPVSITLPGENLVAFVRSKEIPTVQYLEVGSYFPSDPDHPSAFFADTTSALGGVSGLFNAHHQGLMEMLMMRDKIVTAEILLTSEDLRGINFRQLIRIGSELYILNKIKDFNFTGSPTEVELLLVTRTGTNHQIL